MSDLRSRNQYDTTFRGLLKNGKIAKLIKNAVESPVGSTDRKRAQQMLSILRRANRVDGQGGPSTSLFPAQNIQLAPQSTDYSNLVIFPNTPAIRVPFGSKAPTPSMTSPSDNSWASPTPSTMANLGNPSLYTRPADIGGFSAPAQGAPVPVPAPPATPGAFGNLSMPSPAPAPVIASTTIPPYVAAPKQSSTGASTQPPTTQTPAPQTPQGPVPPQSGGIASQYPGVQAAVSSGMGPSMFALQALSNPDYLKTLPGFDKLPETLLKAGPTFAGRIEDLSKSLRTSYHLDDLLAQQTNLMNQGVGLTDRLTDYVRGRDQFLNQTDGMLEKHKDFMLSHDMSNPETRATAQMYGNYLYELRGRQNKRYIEFLNSSVNEYNSKLTGAQTMYATALDSYQRELQMKSAVTQEEYNTMSGALTDMYNTVSNGPKQEMEMQVLKSQLYASQVAAAKDIKAMSVTGSQDFLKARNALEKMGIIDSEGKWDPNAPVDQQTLATMGVPENDYKEIVRIAGVASLTKPDKNGVPPNLKEVASIGRALAGTFGNSDDVYRATARALSANGILGIKNGDVVKQAIEYLASGDFAHWNPFSKGAPTRTAFMDAFKTSGLDPMFLDALYTDYESYPDRKSFGTYALNQVDGGSPVRAYSNSELISNLAHSFASKLIAGH